MYSGEHKPKRAAGVEHMHTALPLLVVFAAVLLSPVLYDLVQVLSAAPGA